MELGAPSPFASAQKDLSRATWPLPGGKGVKRHSAPLNGSFRNLEAHTGSSLCSPWPDRAEATMQPSDAILSSKFII
eukprot:scaffold65901_cov31-Tisochrysis_lutea.AAC.2